jgi:hypothetical protein
VIPHSLSHSKIFRVRSDILVIGGLVEFFELSPVHWFVEFIALGPEECSLFPPECVMMLSLGDNTISSQGPFFLSLS